MRRLEEAENVGGKAMVKNFLSLRGPPDGIGTDPKSEVCLLKN